MKRPEQHNLEIAALVKDGADEQIIALAREFGHIIHPQLSDDELDRLYGVTESALVVIDLKKGEP